MDETRYRSAEQALFADAGIAPTERWLDLDRLGGSARVLDVGDGPPVVFLHGGPMAAATWAYVVAHSPALRCILVDRPGCGLSAPPETMPSVDSFPSYHSDLTADVLDALGLERVSLVGNSLGGYAALCSATAMPARVERLVLAGCPAFVPGWVAPRFFTLLRIPVLGRLLLTAPATKGNVKMFLKQMGEHNALRDGTIPAAMMEWTFAWQRHTATMRHDGAMIAALGTWRDGFDGRLDLRTEQLAAIRTPSLVLVGTEDPVGAGPVADGLAAAMPSCEAHVLDGLGHLPWLGDPAGLAAHITSFVLAERSSRSTP
jgi:2-hydroxy-6-oxonona-2,4-dienedioate hydrolase